jgi:hypothetical protein
MRNHTPHPTTSEPSTGFRIDTSGYVRLLNAQGLPDDIGWMNLSPFAQGYIEAALLFVGETAPHPDFGRCCLYALGYGFSDLAPATLAVMLKDCEAYCSGRFAEPMPANVGKMFWCVRQNNELATLRPLLLILGEDGLVHMKEKS